MYACNTYAYACNNWKKIMTIFNIPVHSVTVIISSLP